MTICNSVYDIVNNKELKCNLRIKDKEKYLQEISKHQNDPSLYVYSFNDQSHNLLEKSGGGLDISDVNSLSVDMLKDYLTPKSRDIREKSIIDKLRHIAIGTEYYDEKYMSQILNNLHQVPLKDEYYKGNSQIDLSHLGNSINQDGGVLLQYLEKKMPALTAVLEIIDMILIPVSSLPPPVGTVGDVASIILAALRGDWAYAITSIIALVPAVGDALGTVGKVILKINKIYTLSQDEDTRYIAFSLSFLLLVLSSLSAFFAKTIIATLKSSLKLIPFIG